MLVDSHCHLLFSRFEDTQLRHFSDEYYSVDNILTRAKSSGVDYLLSISATLDDCEYVSRETFDNINYPKIFGAIGIHPDNAESVLQKYALDDLSLYLKSLADRPHVVSIGECGVDYKIDRSQRESQLRVFEMQCELAKTLGVPLEVHSRCGEDDTISVLKSGNYSGVIHCFSGSENFARQALDLGFYISFSGILTFKNAKEIQDVAKFAPWDRILVETDSPFLAPTPFRGQVNEPAYVRKVAEFLAHIKQVEFDEVCSITTKNFFNIFTKAVV